MPPTTRLSIPFVLTLVLAGVIQTYGQGRPGERNTESDRTTQGSIRGRVILPNGSYTDEAIKITLSTMRGTVTTIYAETQGQFEFQGVAPGTYYLEFEADRQRFYPVTETVQVFRGMPSVLTVALKPITPGGDSKPPTTVTVAELTEKVPDKARKEFEKASIAGNEGRTDEAITHLKKAIAIYPPFVRAHNDLGTYLLAQGNFDEAEKEFRKAIDLDATSFNPILNLGIVLVYKHSFAEAEEQLSKALSLEPDSPAAHLYAGLAFQGQEKVDQAEKDLLKAYSLGGQKFGVALYHLGQLYMNRGDRKAALKSFEEYLSVVPNAPNAAQVTKLIAMLRP